MSGFLTLKSVDEVLAMLQETSRLASERVSLDQALGRVLGTDFVCPVDLPGFTRSTMDGYAVHSPDVFGASEGQPALLDCVGECPMGDAPGFSIQPGQCARIWTGGMLPQGADAVVMLEYSREASGNLVELTRAAAPGGHVILPDEDAQAGERLIPSGTRLRPQEIGLLAALGIAEVEVVRRPRLAVISSGDEVVDIASLPKNGQVRDINQHTISALITAAGGEAVPLGIVRDDLTAMREVLNRAADTDAVILSGGSSAGMRDFTVSAFAQIGGQVLVHGVAISPGKPLILARKNAMWLWGLPGHAASALVCAHVFLRPLIRRLLGESETPLPPISARLTRPVSSTQGRRDYIRVRLDRDAHGLTATPVPGKSGLITTLVLADALIVCPEETEGFSAGDAVPVHPLT